MNILLSGKSGFLGKIIAETLSASNITSIGRNNDDIKFDLVCGIPNLSSYELVIHAAGKAHSVPKTAIEKQEFFHVNVGGTLNLLKGLENAPALPECFIFISSVSVYGQTNGQLITEESPLMAKDAYGLSKIEAENLVIEWCKKHNVVCGILRLPLLVGPNPPGNLKSMINGIKKGYYVDIAGGNARKSMVLAKDVANIIPVIAKHGGVYNLTDRYHPSFGELSSLISSQLGKSKPLNIPMPLAKFLAKAGDIIGSRFPVNADKLNKITSDLTFDDTKAVKLLGWKPTLVLEEFRIH